MWGGQGGTAWGASVTAGRPGELDKTAPGAQQVLSGHLLSEGWTCEVGRNCNPGEGCPPRSRDVPGLLGPLTTAPPVPAATRGWAGSPASPWGGGRVPTAAPLQVPQTWPEVLCPLRLWTPRQPREASSLNCCPNPQGGPRSPGTGSRPTAVAHTLAGRPIWDMGGRGSGRDEKGQRPAANGRPARPSAPWVPCGWRGSLAGRSLAYLQAKTTQKPQAE